MNNNINFLYKKIIKEKKKLNLNSFFKNFISFYLNNKYKEDEDLLNEINIENENNYKKKIKINLKEIENKSKIIMFNGKYIFSENINNKIIINENNKEKKQFILKNLDLLNYNLNFFYILNEILSKNKLSIKILEKLNYSEQLYILNFNDNNNNKEKINTYSNIYIELEKNACININEIQINISENIFNNTNLILNIKESSKLNYNFQNYSSYESINTNSIFSFQENKSILFFEDYFIKKQKTKMFYNFFLKGDKCEFKKKSLRNLEKNSNFETICKIFHLNSNSKSNADFYALSKEKSKCIFNNNVFVDIDNNLIDAKVKIKAITLTDESELILTPELDINSSNIKCSHSATVGTLNEKILFYMMSRGISKKECENIILNSFLFIHLEKKVLQINNMIENN